MDVTGDLVSNWEFFRDSWKNYATATKLADKDKKIVAATLLSIMGKECLHVCRNLPMTADERQDADVILTKLSEYFIPKRNKIYERYVFNSRCQKADESFDQFLTALRKLAATCKFDTFEDEMLRDRIVTGLRDHGHRERLLRESTLTLQKAIDICQTNEMAASQRHKMEQSGTIHFAREEKKRGPRENPRRSSRPTRLCKYCGDTHAAGNCHASGKTCAKRNKKNHLAKVCQSTSRQDGKKSKPEGKKPGKHQRVNQLQQD